MIKRSWLPNYKLPAWAARSKYYLMDFIAGLAGIAISTFLLDRAFFALMTYLSGANTTSGLDDQMNLGVVASLFVILPITLLFYKRSRFEELNRPVVATTKTRRFFLYIFMFVVLAGLVGFAITVVYTVLAVLFGASEPIDTLVRVTVPALLATALHAYVFKHFLRVTSPVTIKEFAVVFGGIALVAWIALLVMTSIQARASLVDDQTSRDLETISGKVNDYYHEKGKLPNSLQDLDLDKSIDRRGDRHGYTYQRSGAAVYRLCAQFKASATTEDDAVQLLSAKRSTSYYAPTYNANFAMHDAGRYCFTVHVDYYGVTPLEDQYPAKTPSSSDDNESLLPAQGSSLY